jgi:hypothetical protein
MSDSTGWEPVVVGPMDPVVSHAAPRDPGLDDPRLVSGSSVEIVHQMQVLRLDLLVQRLDEITRGNQPD